MNESSPPRTASRPAAEVAKDYDRIALVFQGGGALGAYQAGVYEILAKTGLEPTWLSGVSIGAVNAAIIAGNKPENRVARLSQFWEKISGRKVWAHTPQGDFFRTMRNQTSAWMALTLGQPGFFKPRWPSPWFQPPGSPGATSYYDTADLRETLETVVDFDVLNNGTKRFSVGAVNVRSGNFIYFDTNFMRIGPEHIMASGALPPALPAVEIDGEYYWDGGIVSNTPLQYLLDQEEDLSSLVFQVDLFSSRGSLPRAMHEVTTRHKDIMFSSRTRQNTDMFRRSRAMKRRLLEALQRIPEKELTAADRELMADYANAGVVNIIHLIYQQKHYEGDAKDFEFSGTSMREHWLAGCKDTARTLQHRRWLELPSGEEAVKVHDVHRDDPEYS
jgi:NTE family protein